jgi:Tol biopolymer transport system component
MYARAYQLKGNTAGADHYRQLAAQRDPVYAHRDSWSSVDPIHYYTLEGLALLKSYYPWVLPVSLVLPVLVTFWICYALLTQMVLIPAANAQARSTVVAQEATRAAKTAVSENAAATASRRTQTAYEVETQVVVTSTAQAAANYPIMVKQTAASFDVSLLPGKLAFYGYEGNGPLAHVYVADRPGGTAHRVSDDYELGNFGPAISRDGQQVAYWRSNGCYLIIANANGQGEPKQIDAHCTEHNFDTKWGLAWSPDGTQIAYSDSSAIWITSVTDPTPHRKRVATIPRQDLDWSPDGKQLSLNNDIGISILDLDSGQITGVALGVHPVFSPDGGKIAYEAIDYTDHGPVTSIGITDLKTHAQTRLTIGLGGKVTWSPDGRYLAFLADLNGGRSTNKQLFILDVQNKSCCGIISDSGGVGFDFLHSQQISWGP